MRSLAQQMDSKLKKLVDDANIEMGISLEQVNRLFTEETRNLIKKSHLELRNDSVIYICIWKEDVVKLLNDIENLKERQMDVFLYVELNPKFRSLIDYLIKKDLSLYQIFQSPDTNTCTRTIEYESSLLKLFGSLAI